MENQFSRTELLLGNAALSRLFSAHVAVFGVGGVGGYCTEALARSGIGRLTLVDNDRVSLSNINRQIIALHSTVGRYKTEVMRERIADINPSAAVNTVNMFYLPETADKIDLTQFDYIVDAVDTVSAKIELAVRAERLGVPIISSMGAGNKLSPAGFRVSDIYKTSVCPLARVMRRELRARGVSALKVVYSEEVPQTPHNADNIEEKKPVAGSLAFVPSVCGLVIASEVVLTLTGLKK